MKIWVEGTPICKQSFRCLNGGGGYQTKAVVDWQRTVASAALEQHPEIEPTTERVKVVLEFYLPTRHRRDCENLSKGVMDALEGIVFKNDAQVDDLHIKKFYRIPNKTGVAIDVQII